MFSRFFLRRRTRRDPSIASVVANAIDRGVIDHGRVVNIVHVRDIHVVDGTVVEELSTSPFATLIAIAEVAKSVVDSTVESNVRTPIADVEKECRATPTPPSRSPQESRLRRHHPRTRHPIITIRTVSPVTGCPEITGGRTGWLLVHRQRRRTKVDRDADTDLRARCCRQRHHHNCEQYRTQHYRSTASYSFHSSSCLLNFWPHSLGQI